LTPGDRILVIDDWVETGGQLKSRIRLVERRGASIVSISVRGFNQGNKTSRLKSNDKLRSLLEYSAPEARDLSRRLDL
tara:strand:- start:5451 stop:5684 length:234 start_codon:yes stop_codon:yes gene_type:complete